MKYFVQKMSPHLQVNWISTVKNMILANGILCWLVQGGRWSEGGVAVLEHQVTLVAVTLNWRTWETGVGTTRKAIRSSRNALEAKGTEHRGSPGGLRFESYAIWGMHCMHRRDQDHPEPQVCEWVDGGVEPFGSLADRKPVNRFWHALGSRWGGKGAWQALIWCLKLIMVE